VDPHKVPRFQGATGLMSPWNMSTMVSSTKTLK
jgi:hypothetical protein